MIDREPLPAADNLELVQRGRFLAENIGATATSHLAEKIFWVVKNGSKKGQLVIPEMGWDPEHQFGFIED